MNFPRYINAVFLNSHSTAQGTFEGRVILLAPDLTLSTYGHEWVFRIIEPVKTDQQKIKIDLATCSSFKIYLNNLDFRYVDDISKGASFLELVKALAKK